MESHDRLEYYNQKYLVKKKFKLKKMKMKVFSFICKIVATYKNSSQNFNPFSLWKRSFYFDLWVFRWYKRELEEIYDVFNVFKSQPFLEKERGFISEYVNMVAKRLFSLESLKLLKRYVDIFKKQLSLISFNFSF